MAKIIWDAPGKHIYETGVSKGVLYPMSEVSGTYDNGVAWNGLTSIAEKPTGAEVSAVYADNIKYLNLMSEEEFEATIEAYTYPDEFAACDGSAEVVDGLFVTAQTRKKFALCYQTKIGNDLNPEAGYKIHIIYNCLASPSERTYETVNDSPEAMTFSWDVATTPVEVAGFKPTAHIEIDLTKIKDTKEGDTVIKSAAEKIADLEKALYGADDSNEESVTVQHNPTLLFPDQIAAILA